MKCNEIHHLGHPKHKLKFEYSEFPFKCDGCKEVGNGSRYTCSICSYDLHFHCAEPSPSIGHAFYKKRSFQFLTVPPGNKARCCDACEKDVSGFVYHCRSDGYNLHPCCAKLPMELDYGEIKLYLHKKMSSACNQCGIKGRGWSYRSECKKYNLHVACVMEMIVQSWYEIYKKGNKGKGLEMMRIPRLKNTVQSSHGSGGRRKVRKCCKIAGMALRLVILAVLGHPTELIAGVLGALMSPG